MEMYGTAIIAAFIAGAIMAIAVWFIFGVSKDGYIAQYMFMWLNSLLQ